mmetsp:Transcript_32646/g.48722  ORF Transcript_32646/g.48722 Transcript_32646/m.48722 type:complete len:177 (-) Transcript_32646:460-990(-)
MALTEEQRKRMEENRKRALEIRKKREMEKEKEVTVEGFFAAAPPQEEGLQHKKRKVDGANESKEDKKQRSNVLLSGEGENSDDESLEEFERDASAYVSQTEAQKTYCLPKGTIDVLSFIERDNPHQRGFSKMKLYSRAEVRRRARKRFGGKSGLITEREKRKMKRYENELKEVKRR